MAAKREEIFYEMFGIKSSPNNFQENKITLIIRK